MTWWNGEPVFNGAKADECRCYTLDDKPADGKFTDKAKVVLKKGMNTLLVKSGCKDKDGTWGFVVALDDIQGVTSQTSPMATGSKGTGDVLPPFRVDNTGQIFVENDAWLDYEVQDVYTLGVEVKDAGGLTDTAFVTVMVQDINEKPNYAPSLKYVVAENSAYKVPVGAPVTTSDQDVGQSYDYALVGGGDEFDINPSTGQIYVKAGAKLDFEGPVTTYTVFVQSQDDGEPKMKATVAVEITLSDVNEAPSFKDGIVLTIPENSDTGANAGLPVASSVSDPDAGASFTYSSQKIKLEVRSEGCDDKGKTSGCGVTTIRVDGEQVSRKQRGHNVVTLDETTGEVLSAQAFDTYGFKEAGMALRSHLESIEDGRVVIVATQDSANRYSHYADDAMRSIGAGTHVL